MIWLLFLKLALVVGWVPGQVFLPAMGNRYRFELDEHDLGQVLDGLTIRAESWRRTADYSYEGDMPDGEFFMIEECRDAEEANDIAVHYEAIIKNIQIQMEEQP